MKDKVEEARKAADVPAPKSSDPFSADLSIGEVQWHSSEEDGGPDVGILLRISDNHHLWFGEISNHEWENADPEIRALGPNAGWWIAHYTEFGLVVVGRVDDLRARDLIDDLQYGFQNVRSASQASIATLQAAIERKDALLRGVLNQYHLQAERGPLVTGDLRARIEQELGR